MSRVVDNSPPAGVDSCRACGSRPARYVCGQCGQAATCSEACADDLWREHASDGGHAPWCHEAATHGWWQIGAQTKRGRGSDGGDDGDDGDDPDDDDPAKRPRVDRSEEADEEAVDENLVVYVEFLRNAGVAHFAREIFVFLDPAPKGVQVELLNLLENPPPSLLTLDDERDRLIRDASHLRDFRSTFYNLVLVDTAGATGGGDDSSRSSMSPTIEAQLVPTVDPAGLYEVGVDGEAMEIDAPGATARPLPVPVLTAVGVRSMLGTRLWNVYRNVPLPRGQTRVLPWEQVQALEEERPGTANEWIVPLTYFNANRRIKPRGKTAADFQFIQGTERLLPFAYDPDDPVLLTRNILTKAIRNVTNWKIDNISVLQYLVNRLTAWKNRLTSGGEGGEGSSTWSFATCQHLWLALCADSDDHVDRLRLRARPEPPREGVEEENQFARYDEVTTSILASRGRQTAITDKLRFDGNYPNAVGTLLYDLPKTLVDRLGGRNPEKETYYTFDKRLQYYLVSRESGASPITDTLGATDFWNFARVAWDEVVMPAFLENSTARRVALMSTGSAYICTLLPSIRGWGSYNISMQWRYLKFSRDETASVSSYVDFEPWHGLMVPFPPTQRARRPAAGSEPDEAPTNNFVTDFLARFQPQLVGGNFYGEMLVRDRDRRRRTAYERARTEGRIPADLDAPPALAVRTPPLALTVLEARRE